jgi:hypothetical protein
MTRLISSATAPRSGRACRKRGRCGTPTRTTTPKSGDENRCAHPGPKVIIGLGLNRESLVSASLRRQCEQTREEQVNVSLGSRSRRREAGGQTSRPRAARHRITRRVRQRCARCAHWRRQGAQAVERRRGFELGFTLILLGVGEYKKVLENLYFKISFQFYR